MRKFYVGDVILEDHPTAPLVAKVLKVKLIATSDQTDIIFNVDLFGYETAEQFRWNPEPSNTANVKSSLDEVVADLISRVGKDGKLHWTIEKKLPGFEHGLQDFMLSWRQRAFSNALRAFGLTDRLTLEQAKQVLEEHYVVEPVMTS